MVLLVVLIAAVVIIAIAAWTTRSGVKKQTLADRNKQLAIAESALRSIRNSSTGPESLQASIALDEIDTYYQKELE